MALYDFDEFKKEYIFEFMLVNETPLSIGSGHDPSGILDNPVVRMDNKPYIPGSSLKGVFRSTVESIVLITV
ncbi:MAG: hypothetical protein KatS3mg003_1283 [Candidatus Nitrosocaldaceae archaeon]|nr:MAG: hypothetical protein KatS3mg003_1283 [Candidatus Nitrosocaldaceae archaeon]